MNEDKKWELQPNKDFLDTIDKLISCKETEIENLEKEIKKIKEVRRIANLAVMNAVTEVLK